MFNKKAESQIRFEIRQIDKLLESYGSVLEQCKEIELGLIELTAVASALHSFYNGIENMLLMISKSFGEAILDQSQWHRTLLIQMAEPTKERKPVISDSLEIKLLEYLGFRHFYRHTYSFILEWSELKKLVDPLTETWKQFKDEIEIFLNSN